MLNFEKSIWNIIRNEQVSSVVTNSCIKIKNRDFKPLSDKALLEINTKIENEMKKNIIFAAKEGKKELVTVADLKKKADSFGQAVLANFRTKRPLLTTTDSMTGREIAPSFPNGLGASAFGADNIWISPSEAAQIYSSKGISELIIEKKSLIM